MSAAESEWAEAGSSSDARFCREAALLLQAQGIDYRAVSSGPVTTLWVRPDRLAEARTELASLLEESKQWPVGSLELAEPPARPRGRVGAIAYAVTLSILFGLEQSDTFGLDWRDAGRSQAGRIAEGEWWRVVTSLTLHADVGHFAGNLVFGGLFFLFLTQTTGPGLAAFAFVLAGALGNTVNAWLQSPRHNAIGASSGVFATVGLLAAIEWSRRRYRGERKSHRVAPLAIGLMLLGFLGTTGDNTDVLGHCFGLAAGVLLGVAIARSGVLTFACDRLMQALFGLLAVGLLTAAWCAAFAAATGTTFP